jgi:hypothetical protein
MRNIISDVGAGEGNRTLVSGFGGPNQNDDFIPGVEAYEPNQVLFHMRPKHHPREKS